MLVLQEPGVWLSHRWTSRSQGLKPYPIKIPIAIGGCPASLGQHLRACLPNCEFLGFHCFHLLSTLPSAFVIRETERTRMETIPDELSQLAKLCDVCTYLIGCIDDSIKKMKSATWTDQFTYPRWCRYTTTTWLSSARDGCAICIRLLDTIMIQKGRVRGLTSPLTHDVIEGAEMMVSCTADNNISTVNGELSRVVTFRACSENQVNLAEAAAQVIALQRVEGMFCFYSSHRSVCYIFYNKDLLNFCCESGTVRT
jgi:hypothetical protein